MRVAETKKIKLINFFLIITNNFSFYKTYGSGLAVFPNTRSTENSLISIV